MPDRKDWAAIANAAEGKPQTPPSSAAPVKDWAAIANEAEQTTITPNAPNNTPNAVQGATPPAPTPTIISDLKPGETAGLDAQGNEVVRKPRTMQAARGIDPDAARTNVEYATGLLNKYLGRPAPVDKFEEQNRVVKIPDTKDPTRTRVYGLKDGEAFAGERATGAISIEERDLMRSQIGHEIKANEDHIREDVSNSIEAFNKYYHGDKPVINPKLDPISDPVVLGKYSQFKNTQINVEEQQAISDLKARYKIVDQDMIMGVKVDDTTPAYRRELEMIQQEFKNRRDVLNGSVFNVAAKNVVREMVTKREGMSPEDIGLEMLRVTGAEDEVKKIQNLRQRGVPLTVDDRKQLMEAGFRAMQFGMHDAIAEGRDEDAKKLKARIDDPQGQILAALPEYKKTQMARAISDKVASNTSWLARTMGYSVSKDVMMQNARELGFTEAEVEAAGVTPADIDQPNNPVLRFGNSVIKNSLGAFYETGARLGAQTAQANHPDVDLTEFNRRFNSSWYDNSWVGKKLGGTVAETDQLFAPATTVNTQRGEDYLKDVQNMEAGKFTWNVPAMIRQIADGAGQMYAFAEGGRAFGAQLGKVSAVTDRIGLATNQLFTQYGSGYAQAVDAFGGAPEDEGKRELYTMLKVATAALSEQILPDTKVRDALFGRGTAAGEELISAIRKDGFGVLANKGGLRSILGKAVLNGLAMSGKETSEDVLNEQLDKMVDFLVAPQQYAKTDYDKQMEDAAITSAISNFIPTFSGGVRQTNQQNNLNKHLLFQVGANPTQYIDAIQEQIKEGAISQLEGNDKIKLINTMGEIVNQSVPAAEVISGRQLTPEARTAYANHLLQETVLKAQKEGVKDDLLHGYIDTQLAALKASREAILNPPPAPAVSPVQEAVLPAIPADINLFAPNNGIAPAAPPTVSDADIARDNAAEVARVSALQSQDAVPVQTDLPPRTVIDLPGTPRITEDGAIVMPTIAEAIEGGLPYTFNGQRATLTQDGQTVVANIIGTNRSYEIGNIDEVGSKSVEEAGFGLETPVVGSVNNGLIDVRGVPYSIAGYSNPIAAINIDDSGNIVSVNLDTTDGQKRTFRGQVAEDIAYSLHLHQLDLNNEHQQFEDFLNSPAADAAFANNGGVQEIAPPAAVGAPANVPVDEVTGTTQAVEPADRQADQQPVDNAALVQEAFDLSKQSNSMTARFQFGSIERAEEALFETAQQLNSRPEEGAMVRRTLGDRIADIALQMFPNARVGDTFQSIQSPVNTNTNATTEIKDVQPEGGVGQREGTEGQRNSAEEQQANSSNRDEGGGLQQEEEVTSLTPEEQFELEAKFHAESTGLSIEEARESLRNQQPPENIEEVTDQEGGIVVMPTPEKPMPAPYTGIAEPEATGDPLVDATNQYNWRRTVLEKKEARRAKLEQDMADEEDAIRMAEEQMIKIANADDPKYKANQRELQAAQAKLKKLKDAYNNIPDKRMLEEAQKNAAAAKAALDALVDQAAKRTTAVPPVTEEQVPHQEESDKLKKAKAEIARTEARLADLEKDKAANMSKWTKDDAAAFVAEVAALKKQLATARAAKTRASNERVKLVAKSIANGVRSIKGDENAAYASLFGVTPKHANMAIEAVAKAIERGANMIVAIQEGVDYINSNWFTAWDETKFRKLMGEDIVGGIYTMLTPDQIRAQMDSGIPLHGKNEETAKQLVQDIKDGKTSLPDALAAIKALSVSDGIKANMRKYVQQYAHAEVLRPAAEQMASQHLVGANGNFDAAINSLQTDWTAMHLVNSYTPAQLENMDATYVIALSDLQTRKDSEEVKSGRVKPNYNRGAVTQTIFAHREYDGTILWGKVPAPTKGNFEVFKQKFGENFQNRYRAAEKIVESKGKRFEKGMDFASEFQLNRDRANEEKRLFQEKIGNATAQKGSLLRDAHDDGISIQRLGSFMAAQHAPERNAQNAKDRQEAYNARLNELNAQLRNTDSPIDQLLIEQTIDDLRSQRLEYPENKGFILVPDGGIGMTDQDAQDIIDAIAKEGQLPLYEKYAERVRSEIIDQTLDILFDGEIITADTYNKFRRNSANSQHYKFYAPSKVDEEFAKLFENQRESRGSKGSIVQRSRGAADIEMDKRVNPVQQAIHDLEDAIQAKWDNQSATVMANFVEAHGDEQWHTEPALTEDKVGSDGKVIRSTPKPKPANVVFDYKKAGKTHYIVSTNQGIQNMAKYVPLPTVLKLSAGLSRLYSSVYTQFNVEFLLKNPLIDQQDASFSLLGQDDKRFAENFRKIGWKGRAQILAALAGKKNQWTPIIEDARKSGGTITFFTSMKSEQTVNDVEKLFDSLDSKNPLSFANRRKMSAALATYRDSLEELTRVMVYHAALETSIQQEMDGGKSRQEAEATVNKDKAALLARNSTIDFGKSGVYGGWMNAFKVFANASTQGLINTAYLSTKKGEGGNRARKRLFFAAAIGILNSTVARLASDCEDLEHPEDCWDNLSENDKQKNLMIPKFLLFGKGSGYLQIPLGRVGYNWVNYLGTKITDAVFGKVTAGNFVVDVMGAMGNLFNPAGSAPIEQTVVGNMSPLMALAMNKSPFGGDATIRPDKSTRLASQDYRKTTPDIYIEMADKWHEVTGGERGRESKLKLGGMNFGEVSPNQIEFLMQTVGGGVYGLLHKSATAYNHATDEKEGNLQYRDIPVVGMFLKESNMAGTKAKYGELSKLSENNLLTEEEWQKVLDLTHALEVGGQIDNVQRGKWVGYIKQNQQRLRSDLKKQDMEKAAQSPPRTAPSAPAGGDMRPIDDNSGDLRPLDGGSDGLRPLE